MNEMLHGRQPIREVLRAGRRPVIRLHVQKSAKRCPILGEILDIAEERRIQLAWVDNKRVKQLVPHGNAQGVAAECGTYPYVDFAVLVRQLTGRVCPLLLLLDHLEDPQNLGSLLRTADAVGVDGIVIPRNRAVAVTPAVVRVSAGASEHLNIALVTNLAQTMRALHAEGLKLVGLEGSPSADLYTAADLSGPLGLVVGSEGRGLKRLVREACDALVRIPMGGRVASLNAAVAGALALYEVQRQRG